jgi:hypothetical protein
MGDTFDVIFGGTATTLVAGESNSSGAGTRNGYAIFNPESETKFAGRLVSFTGADPGSGDFRAGITFTDFDAVAGSQGTGGFKFTRFNGSIGTLDEAVGFTNAFERPMDFITLGGKPLLATLETNGNTSTPPDTFSTVRVYDLTVESMPILLASGRTATAYFSQGAAGSGTGAVQWGKVAGNAAILYALSTNNGIQAFTVTLSEAPMAFTRFGLTGSQLNLSWTSAPGRSYRVEITTDLQSWAPLPTGLLISTGWTMSADVMLPAVYESRAFVRVVRE